MPAKPAKKLKATKAAPIKRNGESDTSWHERFLTFLGETCNVTEAARASGVDRATAYRHKARFPEFSLQWENAEAQAVEVLEYEAWKRARAQSDTLMIFLLKAHRPEKYRERYDHQHSGKINIQIKPEDLSDDDLAAIAANAAYPSE